MKKMILLHLFNLPHFSPEEKILRGPNYIGCNYWRCSFCLLKVIVNKQLTKSSLDLLDYQKSSWR